MQQGKRAIVVGASSGIGLEVAKLLIEQGWTIGVAARRVELLQGIGAATYQEYWGNGFVFLCFGYR